MSNLFTKFEAWHAVVVAVDDYGQLFNISKNLDNETGILTAY